MGNGYSMEQMKALTDLEIKALDDEIVKNSSKDVRKFYKTRSKEIKR